jgi:hypothetical protein
MHISKWLLSATEFHGIGHCFKPNMKFRDKGKGKGGEGLEKGGRKGWRRAGDGGAVTGLVWQVVGAGQVHGALYLWDTYNCKTTTNFYSLLRLFLICA